MEITQHTQPQEVLASIAMCRDKRDVPKIDPSTTSYHLRITRTNRRRKNKRLYLVEQLEQGKVVNGAVETQVEVLLRLFVERGVPIHTNLHDIAAFCERQGTHVFPLTDQDEVPRAPS